MVVSGHGPPRAGSQAPPICSGGVQGWGHLARAPLCSREAIVSLQGEPTSKLNVAPVHSPLWWNLTHDTVWLINNMHSNGPRPTRDPLHAAQPYPDFDPTCLRVARTATLSLLLLSSRGLIL